MPSCTDFLGSLFLVTLLSLIICLFKISLLKFKFSYISWGFGVLGFSGPIRTYCGPSWCRVDPRRSSRGLKTGPRWPPGLQDLRDEPRIWPQDGPRWARDGVKTSPLRQPHSTTVSVSGVGMGLRTKTAVLQNR